MKKIIEELQSSLEYFIKLSQLQLEFSDKKVFCIRMLEKVLDIQKMESVPMGAHMQFRNWRKDSSVVKSEEELKLTLQYKQSSQSERSLTIVS